MTEQHEGRQAAAGWYPHPTMAGTRRYWDGEQWTDNIAPMEPARVGMSHERVRQISWGIALLFLVPVAALTFMSPRVAGESCGTWISPEFTSIEVSLRKTRILLDDGGLYQAARIEAIADDCNDKLETRRVIVLTLAGLGVGARLALPRLLGQAPQVRAPRRKNGMGWDPTDKFQVIALVALALLVLGVVAFVVAVA